jgi:hypothetical protein
MAAHKFSDRNHLGICRLINACTRKGQQAITSGLPVIRARPRQRQRDQTLPSADILSSVQSSRRFADHFHRETTNTVIVLPHWEKLDNLKFKLL